MTGPTSVRSAAETTVTLLEALRRRYSQDPKAGVREWCFFEQVRSEAWNARTADAIAVNLWESRGQVVHGFEVKATRADWLKELRDPSKAASFIQYCDYWWLVAPSMDIFQLDEIPHGWGVYVLRGSRLEAKVKADKLVDPKPLTRSFLIELLRAASLVITRDAQLRKEYGRGYEAGLARQKKDLESVYNQLVDERKRIHAFETAAGLQLSSWRHTSGAVGAAVKSLLEGDDRVARIEERLHGLLKTVDGIQHEIGEHLRELDGKAT